MKIESVKTSETKVASKNTTLCGEKVASCSIFLIGTPTSRACIHLPPEIYTFNTRNRIERMHQSIQLKISTTLQSKGRKELVVLHPHDGIEASNTHEFVKFITKKCKFDKTHFIRTEPKEPTNIYFKPNFEIIVKYPNNLAKSKLHTPFSVMSAANSKENVIDKPQFFDASPKDQHNEKMRLLNTGNPQQKQNKCPIKCCFL